MEHLSVSRCIITSGKFEHKKSRQKEKMRLRQKANGNYIEPMMQQGKMFLRFVY